MQDKNAELCLAAKRLASEPGEEGLRRALCVAVEECVRSRVASWARRLASWHARNHVEDIVQSALYNTFVKAIRLCESRSLDTNRDSVEDAAYLRRIAQNELIDAAKRIHRQLKSERQGDCVESHESVESSPIVCLALAEQDEHLHRALAGLEKSDRDILDMRFRQDLSYGDIASATRSSQGAVRQRVHRALKRLRKRLPMDRRDLLLP